MTDWNSRYEIGDTPWEKGRPAPPLLEILERLGTDIWGDGRVLVPGCGTGHDVRALAATGLPPLGLDLAERAVELAKSHEPAGAEDYALGDFLDPAWREGKTFSALWEHTCYCAIHPTCRPDYAQACADLIVPGGCLIGVFFLTPNDPDEENQGPPFNSTIPELDERFAPWFEREHAWIPENAYPGREGKEWIAIYRRK
ncbi:MAG: TPMT family class I SAM-dependent methyltransferase [Akkermansiaceae bacterium]|jgi:methyl halide transferase|nr:TPMT family class I SAM-dependent methyltransferase [Akkermansiaceae bacterium]MDP4647480.1 TPMT family class I SAM-dependent methyltransferase [Akkermansiaceae bacterium]MDP4722548.1 TPMT family class I SAM-dependent methyltransferase [Akkermansiaceae bacterium]MDP4779277.1 TPMT family class I SAM-dependent methyltransferase [Akkermansiaceae bacterium]MDP4845972.1 TPMT family class I SAM-dependent methyltransferase [Akkermansiaceae bacterium]